MGLSQEYRKKIKESMDMQEGGRLHAIAEKAAAVKAPVLIIGLGGSGMDSLLATKKMIYDIIEREKKEDGKYSDKPQNIEYLGIDTDQAYENKSYQGIRLNKNAGEVKIYKMPNVQSVLANPELLPEYISKWLDCSMENDSVINGTGAVRQMGRLLLMQNISDISNVLHDKIRKITWGYPGHIPLYVFIIAGISGGTGGGTFIDIPYLVNAVSESLSSRPVYNIGLLFTPDVNANREGIPLCVKNSLYANGFASLKELDYLMNIEYVGDRFEQRYDEIVVGNNKYGKKPYDVCLLLSSKDKNGTVMKECYELAIHAVSETIFNFIQGDSGANDSLINLWLKNELRNRLIYKIELGDRRHPVTYDYITSGACSAILPLDDMMSYLAYKMYKEVECFWNQIPDEKTIEDVEEYFHLSKERIVIEALYGIESVDTSSITTQIVITDHQQVVQLYEETLMKQKEVIIANLEKMLDKLQENLEDKNNILNQYFKDTEKGPVFSQQCLFNSGYEQRSLIVDLHRHKMNFAAAIPSAEQKNSLEQQITFALEDLKHAFIGRSRKLQVYLERLNQLYKLKVDEFLYDQLQNFCEKADDILIDKNNTKYDIAADFLYQMMPVFERYGDIKYGATSAKQARSSMFSWTMVNTPAFIKLLESRMDLKPEFSVNLRTVVQDFYTYLFENIDVLKDENQDVVENINSFMYKEFNVILDKSMDFFLEIIAQSEGKTLDEYCEKIVSELIAKAEVRCPIESAFLSGSVILPRYFFISIPNNSPKLLEAARKAAMASTFGGIERNIVKASGVRGRISVMKFMSPIPLSLNADIKSFYSAYMRLRDSQKGIHLYIPTKVGNQVSDIDWRMLPSPYPESEWVGFTDAKESAINDGYRSVLRKAIEFGYIVEDPMNRTLTLHYGKTVDLNAVAWKYGIDLASDATIKKMDAKGFIEEIKPLLDKESIAERCETHLVRSDMVLDTDGEPKKSYEEMIFIQMYKPRNYIQLMVQNHEDALKAIQIVKKRVDRNKDNHKDLNDMFF